MHLAHTRTPFFLAFVACVLTTASAFYMQRVVGLSPCVLCWMQRWVFIAGGVLSLFATVHAPSKTGSRWYGALLLMLALVGGALAGGQVWLQIATADEIIPVIAWFEQLLDALGLPVFVNRLLSDASFCGEITWTLLGISLPEWSLLGFVGLAMIALWALFKAFRGTPNAERRFGD